ncbi:MAG TPA: multicopper oxidase domain-containing protein, partial [Gemmatimonadales bacterium]|nr:multicopper oxidase domain-containing protein [Gemmatimonadales bacterium]
MVRWPLVGLTWIALLSGSAQPARHDGEIVANDNRTPAGVHRGGSLAVRLVAARGIWYPEEREGPAHEVYAFGEEGRGLSNPGPLLRVTVGTEIEATIHNRIPGATLHLHGLHNRPGKPTVLIVPAGKTRSIRFRAGAPGTYFYWATTRGAGQLRDRFGMESQLTGAFIVDPPGPRPPDHVFVIGIEDDSAAIPALRHIRAAVVNGRSWPHSETATVAAGDTVRMRWINASDRLHPMHLHGFYFTVDSHGDIAEDTLYDAARKRLAVTELLRQGQTFSLTWVPERPGNWLMHCHMAEHMSPHLRGAPPVEHGSGDMPNHALKVMAGLVTGWRVLPSAHSSPASRPDPPRPLRKMRLLVQ